MVSIENSYVFRLAMGIPFTCEGIFVIPIFRRTLDICVFHNRMMFSEICYPNPSAVKVTDVSDNFCHTHC